MVFATYQRMRAKWASWAGPSLKNGPENYVLTDEGDISNYPGVNIKKLQMGH